MAVTQPQPVHNPLLPPGLNYMTLAELQNKCVGSFPNCIERPKLWNGFSNLLVELQKIGVSGELWIDGSFVTDKNIPQDIDLICVVSWDDKYLADDMPLQNVKQLGLQRDAIKLNNFCDFYLIFEPPMTDSTYDSYTAHRKYWMGQWGFDRNDAVKGFAVVGF